jgi:hypothetical protein
MQVTFRKLVEQRCSTWEAVRAKRIRVPGTSMALGRGDLPHDLTQMIVEATLGVGDGFWGCIAQGATFRSTGRRRTRPGRAVIAAHRRGLLGAEQIVGAHVRAWKSVQPTPARDALDSFRPSVAFHGRWRFAAGGMAHAACRRGRGARSGQVVMGPIPVRRP